MIFSRVGAQCTKSGKVLFPKIESAQYLAEINQLNITKKVDLAVFEQTQIQVESNRLTLLNKADLTALAMLTSLVNTKADNSMYKSK